MGQRRTDASIGGKGNLIDATATTGIGRKRNPGEQAQPARRRFTDSRLYASVVTVEGKNRAKISVFKHIALRQSFSQKVGNAYPRDQHLRAPSCRSQRIYRTPHACCKESFETTAAATAFLKSALICNIASPPCSSAPRRPPARACCDPPRT